MQGQCLGPLLALIRPAMQTTRIRRQKMSEERKRKRKRKRKGEAVAKPASMRRRRTRENETPVPLLCPRQVTMFLIRWAQIQSNAHTWCLEIFHLQHGRHAQTCFFPCNLNSKQTCAKNVWSKLLSVLKWGWIGPQNLELELWLHFSSTWPH